MKIMAHRPRTQRIGEDAYPRELFVCNVETVEEAKRKLLELRTAHSEQLLNGYPWNCKTVVTGFIQEPNDSFYLRIDMDN